MGLFANLTTTFRKQLRTNTRSYGQHGSQVNLLETRSTPGITLELQSYGLDGTLTSVYVLCPLLEHVPEIRSGVKIRDNNENIRRKLLLQFLPFFFSLCFSFLTSLTVQAPPDSSLLTSYFPLPSTIFSYLLIHYSTTFHHVLLLVFLISSMMFFFFLHCSLDYFMDSRSSYINPQNIPCIPWLNLSRNTQGHPLEVPLIF